MYVWSILFSHCCRCPGADLFSLLQLTNAEIAVCADAHVLRFRSLDRAPSRASLLFPQ